LETDDETNELYLQWVSCLPGSQSKVFRLLSRNSPWSEGGRVILICHGEEV